MDDLTRARQRLTAAARLREEQRFEEAAAGFAKLAADLNAATDPAVRDVVAEALLNLGVIFRVSGDAQTAAAVFDRIIAGHERATVPYVCALYNKGLARMSLGHSEEAIRVFEAAAQQAAKYTGEDPAPAGCLAGSLMNLGMLHGRAGRLEQSLGAFDEIVRRFDQRGDAASQDDVAHALFNKAVTLRDAGRGQEAIGVFTAIVERFGDSQSGKLRRWAGMALYNKHTHLAELGDLQGAVAATEEMARRFGDSEDPAIRERLAKALYTRAMIIRDAGFAKEALQALWDIERRFASDDNPVIQQVAAAARRRERLTLALADPAFSGAESVVQLDPAVRAAVAEAGEHVAGVMNVILEGTQSAPASQPLKLQEVIQFLDGPQYEAKEGADRETQDWVFRRKLLRQQLERDLKGHLRGAEIVTGYLDRNEPFGLYLRNFDVEAYMARGSGAGEPIRVSLQFPDDGLVEERVAGSLNGRVPFLGVGNNAPVRPDFEAKLPRLLLQNEHWQEAVEELIGSAALIVMNVTRLTPGVEWELATIERLGQQDKTLIILSEPRAEESVSEVAESFYGAKRSQHAPAAPESPQFRAFARIVREAELPADASAEPRIADILADIARRQALTPQQRGSWEEI